ncbi:hypothetical protein N8I77_004003 [Diaporthe amygdali]|uniref:Uncharacterized protein n=1 Tax=Phomopsis amygdali TaxID=1214568 RepID=A0AAD9W6H6_PHOAM|nr:hypothetical protein N8I77_004003 [Diaporthe amygdali]
MCYQETRLHAICNHTATDRIECSDKCAHFDTIEIQLSTYCQSCRQQVDNTAILNSVLRWKLAPCPGRRKKIRPTKTNALELSPASGQAKAKPSPAPARKLSGAKSVGALREAASAPPTRELPPTPKKLNGSASVDNLAASVNKLRLASPQSNTPKPRRSLDEKPTPSSPQMRRRASEAFDYAAEGDGQGQLTRAHTVPKSRPRTAVPQRAPPPPPIQDTPRADELKSPRPSLQKVPEQPPRPGTPVVRDSYITRPSTSTSTSTTNDARKSALVQQTPLSPPQQQQSQQAPDVTSPIPRTAWSLRRSKSSSRMLALASTRDYMHAKLCGGGGLPSSTPAKNLFPPPQKKLIDIHDPEWLARHGLKWDARGLGLVSAAV